MCTNPSVCRSALRPILIAAAVVLAAVAPNLAEAGAAMAVAPNFPGSTFVGDSFIGGYTIFNTSDADVETLTLSHFHLNVSCGSPNHPCPDPSAGVFVLGALGTGAQACAGITFTINLIGAELYELVPSGDVILTRIGSGGTPCTISFDVETTGLPSVDSAPATPGLQTSQVGHVEGSGFSSDTQTIEIAEGLGSDTTTVQFDPSIAVTKDCVDVVGPDGEITFSGMITNTGEVPLFNVALTDSHAGPIALADTDLDPGESVAYGGSYLPPDGEPILNTVTATGDYDVAGVSGQVSAEASDTCQQLIPSVSLDKDCLPRAFGADSNDIEISVENTGETALANCVVSDPLAGYTSAPFDLGVGESTLLNTSATGFADDTVNTASVTCDVVGAAFTVDASDEDLCEVPICAVQLDKQVSCDGGLTWVDVGYGDDIAEPCVGWTAFDGQPGSEVLVRYAAINTGDVDLLECTVGESNALLSMGVLTPFDMPALGGGFEWTLEDGPACSAELAAGEPDTAMISCACAGLGPDAIVTDDDSADFECQTPALQATKVCDPAAGGANAVHIQVSNVGDFPLADCAVEDVIYPDDATCPPAGNGILVESFPLFDLAPGASMDLDTSWADLLGDACNTVTVQCDIVGINGASLSAMADDVCEVSEGCLTRTPGFWGTHPHITELFLPVSSCGLALDSTLAWTDGSTTEDVCMDNQDARAADTSMQQLQLIRQCTAAQLNIAASLELGGSCTSDYPGLATMIEECCADVCVGQYTGQQIGGSGCIEWLDAFNNSQDTLSEIGTPFERPGPADSTECDEATGNGFVNPRPLGPSHKGLSLGDIDVATPATAASNS